MTNKVMIATDADIVDIVDTWVRYSASYSGVGSYFGSNQFDGGFRCVADEFGTDVAFFCMNKAEAIVRQMEKDNEK